MKEKKEKPTEYELHDVETAEEQPLPPNVTVVKSRWWLRYVITAAVLAVFTVLLAWSFGAFTETHKKELLLKLCDSFFIPGFLAVGYGLLVVVSNGGAFDMLSYGVQTLFRMFKKDPVDRKYGGYYEYREARKEKKRTFWYFIIVGSVFVAVGGALLGAYYAA